MKYLHIGQHWGARRITCGIEFIPPDRLEHMSTVNALKNWPFNVQHEIKEHAQSGWGELVFLINPDESLTFVTDNADSSD